MKWILLSALAFGLSFTASASDQFDTHMSSFREVSSRDWRRPTPRPIKQRVKCIASNRSSRNFTAVGRDRGQAARNAIMKCRSQSRGHLARTCHLVSCRKLGRNF